MSGVAALRKQLDRNADWRDERGQCITDPQLLTKASAAIAELQAGNKVMLEALETASWLLADLSPDGLVKKKVDAAITRAQAAAS